MGCHHDFLQEKKGVNFIAPFTLKRSYLSLLSLSFSNMHSISSPAVMRPISLSASSRFLSQKLLIPCSFFSNFKTTHQRYHTNFTKVRTFIRNCTSPPVSAKPSSQIRWNRTKKSEPDKKLQALRELFSRPGIGIDAYIIPSQDAHQVRFFLGKTFIWVSVLVYLLLELNWVLDFLCICTGV